MNSNDMVSCLLPMRCQVILQVLVSSGCSAKLSRSDTEVGRPRKAKQGAAKDGSVLRMEVRQDAPH